MNTPAYPASTAYDNGFNIMETILAHWNNDDWTCFEDNSGEIMLQSIFDDERKELGEYIAGITSLTVTDVDCTFVFSNEEAKKVVLGNLEKNEEATFEVIGETIRVTGLLPEYDNEDDKREVLRLMMISSGALYQEMGINVIWEISK